MHCACASNRQRHHFAIAIRVSFGAAYNRAGSIASVGHLAFERFSEVSVIKSFLLVIQ